MHTSRLYSLYAYKDGMLLLLRKYRRTGSQFRKKESIPYSKGFGTYEGEKQTKLTEREKSILLN